MTSLAVSVHWMMFALAALMGLAAWLVYVWAVRDGQFQDVEEPARRMLETERDDPSPDPSPDPSYKPSPERPR